MKKVETMKKTEEKVKLNEPINHNEHEECFECKDKKIFDLGGILYGIYCPAGCVVQERIAKLKKAKEVKEAKDVRKAS